MFDEVIRNIGFSTQFEGEKADFGGLRHNSAVFSSKNFRQIVSNCSGSIAFVDGGNAEIIKSPSFSLQLCRVAYCVFSNNQRIKQDRKDFFVLVNVKDSKFIAKTFGEDINVIFDIDDINLKIGKARGSVSSVVSAIRRFAELKLASSLEADVIVLDGSLQQLFTFEDKFFRDLKKKNIVGFCKSTSLLTKSGNSVSALMNLHKGKFAYHPIAELFDDTYHSNVCFARLHSDSSYVFKIDFSKDIDDNVLSLLAENSKDPVFLGYPYGLVLVDKLARVSNDEAEYLKTKFFSKIDNEELLRYLNALNAHEVLDKI